MSECGTLKDIVLKKSVQYCCSAVTHTKRQKETRNWDVCLFACFFSDSNSSFFKIRFGIVTQSKCRDNCGNQQWIAFCGCYSIIIIIIIIIIFRILDDGRTPGTQWFWRKNITIYWVNIIARIVKVYESWQQNIKTGIATELQFQPPEHLRIQ
jgi:hypothetical protein